METISEFRGFCADRMQDTISHAIYGKRVTLLFMPKGQKANKE